MHWPTGAASLSQTSVKLEFSRSNEAQESGSAPGAKRAQEGSRGLKRGRVARDARLRAFDLNIRGATAPAHPTDSPDRHKVAAVESVAAPADRAYCKQLGAHTCQVQML